jgi:hypothetical protein
MKHYDPEHLIFNGIDGATGDYLLPPLSPSLISARAQGHLIDPQHLNELRAKAREANEGHLGLADDVNPKNLAETGWGVIFAHGADPAVRKKLSKLLDHRNEQAGAYYKEYVGADAYRPGESSLDFLTRHKAAPGPANPNNVPYYLLIVGDPESIDYRFQYQLDVQYGVGRLHFETPDEYAQYADSVVLAETSPARARPHRAAFFGVKNPDDRATAMSAEMLVAPLAKALSGKEGWSVETIVGDGATKSKLTALMGGSESPSLIFTAGHGMGYKNGDIRQLKTQGALLCQDWPGPLEWHNKPVPPEFYFSAADVGSDASLRGVLAVHFACYGLGTPQLDEFSQKQTGPADPIAPHSFVAHLPQRLLSQPGGNGALAVIGHVERAWSYSFAWPGADQQIEVFRAAMKRLMTGFPVGYATEFFNQRYAELATHLNLELDNIKFGATPDDLKLSGLWTANNDARNYAVLGDPAVRLA